MLRVDTTDTDFVSSRETYVSIREENERKRINIPEGLQIVSTIVLAWDFLWWWVSKKRSRLAFTLGWRW